MMSIDRSDDVMLALHEPFYVHREFQEMIEECADDGT